MVLPYPYNLLKLQSEDDRHWRFFCPFHNETKPSFTINKTNPFRLFFRCWGCGINGSPKKFARLMGLKTNPIIEGFVEMRSEERPKVDWEKRLQTGECPEALEQLAEMVGVSLETIEKFNIGWNPNRDYTKSVYLIPMYDETEICGIQETWFENGERKKKCQRYSKHGWFINQKRNYNLLSPCFICEGFTDTAVITELGYLAYGRFNALMVDRFPYPIISDRLYIISDTDKCGIQGSKKLQKMIPNSKILYPFGFKDVREMYLKEGTKKTKQWIDSNL